MLNARNAILAALGLAVLTLGATLLSLAAPPDSDGLGRDSYGTRAYGARGLFEVLRRLRLPVERGLVPPSVFLDRRVTLLFWQPNEALVRAEPKYLTQVGAWVRAGGRVVLVPEYDPQELHPPLSRDAGGDEFTVPTSALQELGLKDLELETIEPGGALPIQNPPSKIQNSGETAPRPYDPWLAWQGEERLRKTSPRTVKASGSLGGLPVSQLELPAQELRVLAPLPPTAPTLAGSVGYRDADGQERLLVAAWRLELGEVLVVSEPALFMNRLLGRADNAVLVVNLLAADSRPIVCDEFYHGLTVRSNPAWLLGRAPYGLLALILLGAGLVWVWRQAVRLGPALATPPPSRRTVIEYVEAMAGLFARGRARAFMLRELRDGTLWWLRRRLGLGPRQASPAAVVQAVARRDAAGAARLAAALATTERVLAGGKDGAAAPASEPAAARALAAAKELKACLKI